tara:strand:+ start:11362 stop:11811 length:450 start_codon:yes stop_codon:yes gene_type:complete
MEYKMSTKAIVKDIMSTELITIERYANFSELRNLLEKNDIHHIPVVDGEQLLGILSTTDVLKYSFGAMGVGQDKKLDKSLDQNISLDAIMQTQVVTVTPDTPIMAAAELLLYSNFNALPVVDASQKLVGILTTKDFIGYMLKFEGKLKD